jgi:hypothetical protein
MLNRLLINPLKKKGDLSEMTSQALNENHDMTEQQVPEFLVDLARSVYDTGSGDDQNIRNDLYEDLERALARGDYEFAGLLRAALRAMSEHGTATESTPSAA